MCDSFSSFFCFTRSVRAVRRMKSFSDIIISQRVFLSNAFECQEGPVRYVITKTVDSCKTENNCLY